MDKTKDGLEALAGEVPPPPAEASSPALCFSILHFPFSIQTDTEIPKNNVVSRES
jgi:hypothetical protein